MTFTTPDGRVLHRPLTLAECRAMWDQTCKDFLALGQEQKPADDKPPVETTPPEPEEETEPAEDQAAEVEAGSP